MTTGPETLALMAKRLRRLRLLWAKSTIEGFVDGVTAGEVVGWAQDTGRPQRRVHIVALADGVVIAETLADLPRNDLLTAGKGDGRYGFRLRIPPEVANRSGSRVLVQALSGNRKLRLQRGEITFASGKAIAPPAPAGAVQTARSSKFRGGVVEFCGRGVVSGWAIDPSRKDRAEVDVFDDERYLGSAFCDLERPDLLAARPEARGFLFSLPGADSPDISRSLRVRMAGQRIDLRYAPGYPAPSDPDSMATPERDQASALALTVRSGLALVVLDEEADVCGGPDLTGGFESVVRRTDADFAERLRAAIEVGAVIIFVDAPLEDASGLAGLDPSEAVDVWSLSAGSSGSGAETRLEFLLGAPTSAIAIRASALAQWPGLLDAPIDIDRLARWAAQAGLRWGLAPQSWRASLPSPHSRKSARPMEPGVSVRRISIGLWAASNASRNGLLSQCRGLDVEILSPAPPEDGTRIEALVERHGLASLSMRLVDHREAEAPASLWRAYGGAATGQALVLCHGDVELTTPGGLHRMLAWISVPGVAAVVPTLRAKPGPGSSASTADRGAGASVPSGCAGYPIAAPSPAFAVLDRSLLARAGGFGLGTDAHVDLGTRLAASGNNCICLTGVEAVVASSAPVSVSTGKSDILAA